MKTGLCALILGVVVMAGCGGAESAADDAAGSADAAASESSEVAVVESEPVLEYSDTTELFRGIVMTGPEVDEFIPCGHSEAVWFRDRSGGKLERASRDLGIEMLHPFYVELRGKLGPPLTSGPGARYGILLTVEELLEAAADTARCAN